MRARAFLGRLTLTLVALGATTSVALSMADQKVWRGSAWQKERYRSVASYLDARSKTEARIFVWGNSPEIYLYARRRMATRYMSVNYQTGRVWGTPANEVGGRPDLENVPTEAWDNLMADLERNRPEYIVDAAAGKLAKMDEEPIARHPRIAAFVREHYREEATVLGVPVYRRL